MKKAEKAVIRDFKAEYDKLKEECKFLREAHNADVKTISQLRKAVLEVDQTVNALLTAVVKTYGTPIEGDLVEYVLAIPKPIDDGGRVYAAEYERYVGLDKQQGYRLGLTYKMPEEEK